MTEFNNSKDEQSSKFINLNLLKCTVRQMQKKAYLQSPVNKTIRFWKFRNENSEVSEISHYKFMSFRLIVTRNFFVFKPKDNRNVQSSLLFMNIQNFTCEYLLKEKYLDYELSGYDLGTRAIVYQWLFFL